MIDFDWFYYISTVHLNMRESDFWRSTPRKIGTLWRMHKKFNGWEYESSKMVNRKLNIENIPFI